MAAEKKAVRFEKFSRILKRWFSVIAYTQKEGYFVTVFEDITQRRLLEEELIRAKDELEIRVAERTAELKEANLELKNSEKELRQLSSRLLFAQEEERKRIAGEIHDSIGSSLSAIKFSLEAALLREKSNADLATTFKSLIQITEQSIEEARRLMSDLRPSVLDDMGLIATLNWYCRRFESIYPDIRVTKEIVSDESIIPESLKIVIYRIIQEAFNNLAKYSEADTVNLSLVFNEGCLKLSVKDNGRGFDAEKVLRDPRFEEKGFGLTSMKERTDLSHGVFEIDSAKGNGTAVRASWKIVKTEEDFDSKKAFSG